MQEQPAFATLVQAIQNLEYKAQEEPLDILFERLKPKIQQALFQTSPDRREDLEQEIRIKLMEIARNYQWKEGPEIDHFIRWD
ncbi:hypothetical protein [Salinicoccus roseus]|uniref:Uncharacterized protein n=1 Tax=Salinicoccus roseus TaxID=45670 RepID=A0A265E3R9_9STAP|nr:hypothetical protein [Salinicoccus roseus]OZT76211.1 hypothetical protein CFN03_12820 [Salinicoccus roseus]